MKKFSLLPIAIYIFISLVVFQGEIEAKTSASIDESKDRPAQKNTAKVDGFKSAKFGMTEKEVLKSIFKDYKIPKSKIRRRIHPNEKTVSFNFRVKNLLPNSGFAKMFYVFGFETKQLIQVNILWDRTSAPQFNPQILVDTANQLRTYFLGQKFKKEGLAINAKLSDGSVLVFRGIDFKGQMVVLLLVNPASEEGDPPNQNINLRLSYILNTNSPDIYKIKKNEF